MTWEETLEQQPGTLENRRTATSVRLSEPELAIEAQKLLEDVRIALGHDLGTAIKATTDLAALLGANLLPVEHARPARGGLAPWQKRQVLDHIESHLDGPISVESLAKLASLSGGYFCRAFKESFGQPPHAYITRRRVERAQELMLETSEPLCQIALACGLADQAHFCRRFRQTIGMTPGAWRRSHADGRLGNFELGEGAAGSEDLPDGLARTTVAG